MLSKIIKANQNSSFRKCNKTHELDREIDQKFWQKHFITKLANDCNYIPIPFETLKAFLSYPITLNNYNIKIRLNPDKMKTLVGWTLESPDRMLSYLKQKHDLNTSFSYLKGLLNLKVARNSHISTTNKCNLSYPNGYLILYNPTNNSDGSANRLLHIESPEPNMPESHYLEHHLKTFILRDYLSVTSSSTFSDARWRLWRYVPEVKCSPSRQLLAYISGILGISGLLANTYTSVLPFLPLPLNDLLSLANLVFTLKILTLDRLAGILAFLSSRVTWTNHVEGCKMVAEQLDISPLEKDTSNQNPSLYEDESLILSKLLVKCVQQRLNESLLLYIHVLNATQSEKKESYTTILDDKLYISQATVESQIQNWLDDQILVKPDNHQSSDSPSLIEFDSDHFALKFLESLGILETKPEYLHNDNKVTSQENLKFRKVEINYLRAIPISDAIKIVSQQT
ncbi:uncharacterized protein LOC135924739 isoform X2 [Gordionus sp. m RMFG-2023]|uniref:uncharacterized protein LOC135924739 isoform X2 n=1 Tax=Gordionus sp. m RMFG-2023 TaxID=3053472 RepID=UPI0031FE1E13